MTHRRPQGPTRGSWARVPLAAFAGLALSACSADKGDSAFPVPEAAELVDSTRALRLDVYPPGNLELLPQSFTVLPADIEEIYLALAPTLEITGTVVGTLPSPVDITVPSAEEAPVEARVTLEVPGTIMRATTTTSADGTYAMEVPSGVGYRMVAVALDPIDLPLFIEEELSFSEDTALEVSMGLGVPVSGTALETDGGTLPAGSIVHLVDARTGESGPDAELTATGDWMLRALPGDYTLVLEGTTGSTMPTVPFELSVEEESLFHRLALVPGVVDVSAISGSVVDQDGRPVDDAEVRFTAQSLADLPADASHQVSTDTDRNGLFTRQLAHGTWLMEVIPAYEETTMSPMTAIIEVSDGATSVGTVTLGTQARLDAKVMVGGQPARDIVVTAVEQSFKNYTYTATSDDEGWIHLDVPDVPLNLTLQSPDADQPITRLEVPAPADVSRIDLDDEGSLVAGVLLDPDGVPLPYALVEIRDHEGVLLGTTLTDASGDFRVTVALLEDFELDSGR